MKPSPASADGGHTCCQNQADCGQP